MNVSIMRPMVLALVTVLIPNIASAYYAAHMGRFTTRDPYGDIARIGTETQPLMEVETGFIARDTFVPTEAYHDGMNLYQYVSSMPIHARDPSGLIGLVEPWPGGAPLPCTKKVIAEVTATFGPNDSDKYKHCVVSCYIKRECSTLSSIIAGIGKEIIDVIGPGNAEWGDLVADKDGWVCKDKPSCEEQCRKKYP